MSSVTEIDFVKDGPTPRASEVTASHVVDACEAVGMDVERFKVRYNGREGLWKEGRGPDARALARSTKAGHILVITDGDEERRFLPDEK